MRSLLPIDRASLLRHSALGRDYPDSFVQLDTAALWIEKVGAQKRLALAAPATDPLLGAFDGAQHEFIGGSSLKLCPLSRLNSAALRHALPWLQPVPLGLGTTAGFGDRLGLATPGHVRALRAVSPAGAAAGIGPLFAQQSIREMSRTGRTPSDVLADATWGAFEAGWREPLGADADHLKTTVDIDATVAAGYSWYTLDPSEYVDDSADMASPPALRRAFESLPWRELQTRAQDLLRRMTTAPVELEDRRLFLSEEMVTRAAVKYGGAVAHVHRLYRHLEGKRVPFELEISVDETEIPTSQAEHVYVVSELQRLGVRWISFAPRYVGRFEKGVDFIGDLGVLQKDLVGHASIGAAFGPYKLSMHSGSDKFSVYPFIREATDGLVHLKTAGTSYLEALRVTAQVEPSLFRDILAHGCARYDIERASYHVSASTSRVPNPTTVADQDLPQLMDDFDTRQVLHVTFGSALARFRPRLFPLLQAHEHRYAVTLQQHFERHLAPLVAQSGSPHHTREV